MRLFKRGQTWWVSAYLPDGVRVRRSTGEQDYEAAKAAAMELLAPVSLRDAAARMSATAAAVEAKLRRADDIDGSRVTLAEAWKRYPLAGRRGVPKSPKTVENARSAWSCFVRAMEERGHVHLGEVSAADAQGYLASLRPRWRQVSWQALTAVYSACKLPHPFGARPGRATEVQHREPLTLEQIHRLFEVADARIGRPERWGNAAEYALLLRFLLYTGLRLGDAVTVRVAQIDWQELTLERVMAKTGRRVVFPLHPALVPLLPREGEYVFPRLAMVYQKYLGTISQHIRVLFRDAGITDGDTPRQAYCAHCLRTTFASLCAQNGVPIAVIQSWLGHTSQEVTRIYARVEDLRAKREALGRFPTLE